MEQLDYVDDIECSDDSVQGFEVVDEWEAKQTQRKEDLNTPVQCRSTKRRKRKRKKKQKLPERPEFVWGGWGTSPPRESYTFVSGSLKRRSRSRTPERHPRSRTPERHPRSGTPERHPRSRTTERHPRSRTPERHPRSGTPEKHPRSRTTERHPRSRTPERRRELEKRSSVSKSDTTLLCDSLKKVPQANSRFSEGKCLDKQTSKLAKNFPSQLKWDIYKSSCDIKDDTSSKLLTEVPSKVERYDGMDFDIKSAESSSKIKEHCSDIAPNNDNKFLNFDLSTNPYQQNKAIGKSVENRAIKHNSLKRHPNPPLKLNTLSSFSAQTPSAPWKLGPHRPETKLPPTQGIVQQNPHSYGVNQFQQGLPMQPQTPNNWAPNNTMLSSRPDFGQNNFSNGFNNPSFNRNPMQQGFQQTSYNLNRPINPTSQNQMFMPNPGMGIPHNPPPQAIQHQNQLLQQPSAPQYNESFFIGQSNVPNQSTKNVPLFPIMYLQDKPEPANITAADSPNAMKLTPKPIYLLQGAVPTNQTQEDTKNYEGVGAANLSGYPSHSLGTNNNFNDTEIQDNFEGNNPTAIVRENLRSIPTNDVPPSENYSMFVDDYYVPTYSTEPSPASSLKSSTLEIDRKPQIQIKKEFQANKVGQPTWNPPVKPKATIKPIKFIEISDATKSNKPLGKWNAKAANQAIRIQFKHDFSKRLQKEPDTSSIVVDMEESPTEDDVEEVPIEVPAPPILSIVNEYPEPLKTPPPPIISDSGSTQSKSKRRRNRKTKSKGSWPDNYRN